MSASSQHALAWQRLPAMALAEARWRTHWDRLNGERERIAVIDAQVVCAALAEFDYGHVELFVASDAGEVVAMLLIAPQGRLRLATFQPSQLPLGAWVASSHWSASALAISLLHWQRPWRLALSITQIDPLQAPREPDAAAVRHDDYITTAWLDIAGSFEEYWASRGKNLRQNLRKQRQKLAAEGIVTHMRCLTEPAEMEAALRRYGALERSGWKARTSTHVSPDNAQGRFYLRLFEGAARRGEARIYEYLFNERTVAMNLGLLRAGKLIVLKTAYDASVDKAISPASLLREEELRAFFAGSEVRRIEYYGRVMEWHGRLTDKTRVLHHLSCYRWPLLRRLIDWRRHERPPNTDAADAADPTAPTQTDQPT